MKKYILALLVVSSLTLAACTQTQTQEGSSGNSETGSVPAAEDKSGETTKSGMLVKQGEKYYIKAANGKMEEVESYGVEFSQFENQSVTVVGQYSGDTLFVGKIYLAVE
ncbi:MAG: hypothetical protein GW762_01485 [Candidatus Pacebacteria bacterium]|nr:hypothetical protein [Candidatus Paceibacterota bacterium]PIR64220.1 MAG: hypothetical protein COU64_00695 [Candidatus Pacebacteria bacterium CG10_big_fil_rev_8_21_14_0_10_40_26]PIZ79256.1 MAG: hypothetical protein COY01_02430 [Candidatus Pacebacteria bacterium CG_4_10_14_0_2_um_filter_40_20]PJA68912.1 MAG: hypothetical protein CO156_03040 [Candidatus Pacebacteria bacterium CG_4_9_14_3_um_filter_40_12]PJC42223.1 MAG: hypothetical protein CO041_01140 [Candidatus Pacebacteria bacterium CG_4_9_